MVTDKLKEWSQLWEAQPCDEVQPEQVKGPWLENFDPQDPSEELPPLTTDAFLRVCAAFKTHTGIGTDNFHPRTWLQHQQEGAEVAIANLEKIEEQLRWPLEVGRLICVVLWVGWLRKLGLEEGHEASIDGRRALCTATRGDLCALTDDTAKGRGR